MKNHMYKTLLYSEVNKVHSPLSSERLLLASVATDREGGRGLFFFALISLI